MATIGQISQAAGYQGNAALGGSIDFGVTIDPSPIQRLATFTYYRDRDLWEKQNADDKLAAQQIANISAYDISSPLKPYSDDLKKELGDIQEFVRNNPDALVYSRSPEKFQELNERMNRFNNKRKGATVNDTLYNATKSKIELIPNKQDRDAQLELLDLNVSDLFKEGLDNAYQQQIKMSPDLKPQDYVIPDIPLTEDFTITRNPNDTEITGLKFIDVSRLKPMADAVYFGLGQPLNENTPEFKSLPEEEKKRARLEASITGRTRTNLDNIAASVNGLVQQVKAGNPDLKVMDIPDQVLSQNSSIGGVISLSKEYNATMDKINARTGNKYPHINLDDGATPQELIELQTFGKNKEAFLSEIKPTVQQTDNLIQGAQLAETIRHNKASENLNRGQLKLEQDKWKSTMTGGETVKNGAMERAKRIYNDLKKIADPSGVISPEKLRRLNTEQLKYLGMESLVEGKPVFSPLALGEEDVIQLIDGEIRIHKEAKKLSDGRYAGDLERTKTTNIFNVATNILNEQLKNAGAKELNAYLPIDLATGGVSENTTGGSTSASGGTRTTSQYSNTTPATYNGKKITAGVRDGKWYNTQTGEELK
jgi:hypothetical protein